MRPNRTLTLALPLALLGVLPLLPGCVDEELEPINEPPEAIGPELPEGVSTGPGRSIVIDKGLAAEGDPLADRGGFECDDIPDCWKKCKVHCYCEPTETGFCCCNGGDLSCGLCQDDDDCQPGGGGGGREEEEEDEDDGPGGPMGLDCPHAVRGSHGSCTVYAGGIDPDSLRFDWSVDGMTAHSETGRLGMRWGGYATEDLRITVEIKREGGRRHGRRVWRGNRTVRVSPRNWRLQTQHASPSNSSHIEGWGLYDVSIPRRSELRVAQGTGPWAGSYYLSGSPRVYGAAMYIHSDLAPGGPPYPIPASDTICGVSNQNVGMHSLNKTCGYIGVLNSFRAMVKEHEYKHQESLNKCIRAVNPRRLPDIEEITGSRRRATYWLEGAWH